MIPFVLHPNFTNLLTTIIADLWEKGGGIRGCGGLNAHPLTWKMHPHMSWFTSTIDET